MSISSTESKKKKLRGASAYKQDTVPARRTRPAGRASVPLEKKIELVNEMMSQPGSGPAIAEREGIRLDTLYSWASKLRKRGLVEGTVYGARPEKPKRDLSPAGPSSSARFATDRLVEMEQHRGVPVETSPTYRDDVRKLHERIGQLVVENDQLKEELKRR